MRKVYTILVFMFIGLVTIDSAGQSLTSDSTANATIVSEPAPKVKKWKKSEWIVPSSLIVTGGIVAANKSANEYFFNNHGVRDERNEHFKNFSTRADNILQYTPTAAVFALSLSGVKGRNNLPNQLALFVKSELLMTAIVFPTKLLVGERRPDTGAKNSFPSGHTAQAFAAATFLAKEYGYKNVWYSVAAYTVATGVATCRVLNNRHWLSDVIAGAGVGILSTNIVYATHQHKWGNGKNKNKNALTVTPTYGGKTAGFYLSYKF